MDSIIYADWTRHNMIMIWDKIQKQIPNATVDSESLRKIYTLRFK